jgi:hypothetical protein
MFSGDSTDGLGNATVSTRHDLTIWRTGNCYSGNHWGGAAYQIDFGGGTWKGGVLDEIQIVGADAILPAENSNNALTLNGDFRFENGSSIWIVDDGNNGPFSALGSLANPKKYRVSSYDKTGEGTYSRTKIYLSENLHELGVPLAYASATWSETDLGIRVVGKFTSAIWDSGIWGNGIFENSIFNGGLWIDGVFVSGIMNA